MLRNPIGQMLRAVALGWPLLFPLPAICETVAAEAPTGTPPVLNTEPVAISPETPQPSLIAPPAAAAIPVIPAPIVTVPVDTAPIVPAPIVTVPIDTVPGMPPVVDASNIYSEAREGHLSPATAGALSRVYVPHIRSGDVWVIDPATNQVVDKLPFGRDLQHIVPSWDLKTLWITASQRNQHVQGAMIAIDPKTGKPTANYSVPDAYNLYFTPDGTSAIVVVENSHRLDFRDPQTMKFQKSITIKQCSGINHADFSIDGRYAIFTCEFSGKLVKIDMVTSTVIGFLQLIRAQKPQVTETTGVTKVSRVDAERTAQGMPQDIRLGPDGKTFFVADMMSDGVTLVDGDRFQQVGFIPTGIATHGLYPSRDGTKLYVTNRGSYRVNGPPHGQGSISVIDFATRRVVATWPIPGGGSPDMGNVSADGKQLWVSGRFDNVVYNIDTTSGLVTQIPVGNMPHGLTIWPQPGRYCLGHTGVMR